MKSSNPGDRMLDVLELAGQTIIPIESFEDFVV